MSSTRSRGTASGLLLTTVLLACEGKPPPVGHTVVSAADVAPARASEVALLKRERDDALRRALDAERAVEACGAQRNEPRARELEGGGCETVEYENGSAHERDALEHMIGSVLDRTAIVERALREALPGLPRQRRDQIERALRDAVRERTYLESALRRMRSVTDAAWPRFRYEIQGVAERKQRALDKVHHQLP
jgi:hypothetical protein